VQDGSAISQKHGTTKFTAGETGSGGTTMGEKPSDFETQSGSAKSTIIGQIVRLVRRGGLDSEGWSYVSKRVRPACELTPAKKGRKMPRVLGTDEFRRFYAEVDKADDVQHALMLRLLFFTGVRLSELSGVLVADVDLDACKIRVNQGKGSKDRYVLFGKTFATALRPHIAAHGTNSRGRQFRATRTLDG
jgi:integrase